MKDIVNKIDIDDLRKTMQFYNFEENEIIKGKTWVITFADNIKIVTFSDLNFTDNHIIDKRIFQSQKRQLTHLIRKITQCFDEECIIFNYGNKWIQNKRLIPMLSSFFEENKISNYFQGGLRIDKNSIMLELLIRSAYQYNSFIDIVFPDNQFSLSPTDHMDIFLSTVCKNQKSSKIDSILELIQEEHNMKIQEFSIC